MKASVTVQGFDLNKAAIERYYEVDCFDDDVERPESEFRFFLMLEAENGQRFSHRHEFETIHHAEVFRQKVGVEINGGEWLDSLLAGDNEHWVEGDPAYGSEAWVANDCEYLLYDERETAFYLGR